MIDFTTEAKKIFLQLNFKPEIEIRAYPKSGYFLYRGKFNEKAAILRLSPATDVDKYKSMLREKIANDVLKYVSTINITEIYSCGKNDFFVWLAREYKNGNSLGKQFDYNADLLRGYDELNDRYISNTNLAEKIVKSVKSMHEITLTDYSNTMVFEQKFPRFRTNLETYKIKAITDGLKIDLRKVFEFYNQNKQEYLNSNLSFVMNDLIPSNLLVENNEILFIDFEWFGIDNPMIDFALLWLFMWRYPSWQKEIIKLVCEGENDKLNFCLSIIRILMAKFDEYFAGEKFKNTAAASEFFRKHIWLKYFIAASKSFELLISVEA